MAFPGHDGDDSGEFCGGRNSDDIGARHHDVLDAFFSEAEEVAQHCALLRVVGGIGFGVFVDQFLDRFAQ